MRACLGLSAFCEQSAVKSIHGPGISGSTNVHMVSEGP